MFCLSCTRPTKDPICGRCSTGLVAAPEAMTGGVLVRAAFVHEGAARVLVHRLKYQASPRLADVLGMMLVPLVPADAEALVPVPRVVLRRWRYAIDPSAELARALSRHTGLAVVASLRPVLWAARRAGSAGRRRGTPRFLPGRPAPPSAVLVDDVVTTGATLEAARAVCGLTRAVAVTSAVRP